MAPLQRKAAVAVFLLCVLVNASCFSFTGYFKDSYHSLRGKLTVEDDIELPLIEYLERLNYPVKAYKIPTKDGYILTYHRVQARGTQFTKDKPVVFLQHGLISSSDAWVVNREENAPALVLANAGYDVWLGNSRGNFHSKEHTVFTSSSPSFWDFTWDEMVKYDLPAAFSYITKKTGRKINYIGHSQGTLIMFAALSLGNKEIENSMESFIALAPIAFLHHLSHGLLGHLSSYKILSNLNETPLQEVYTYTKRSKKTLVMCKISPTTCNIAFEILTGETTSCIDTSRLPYMRAHGPGGTSLKNVMHFEQMMHAPHKMLSMFDYGAAINKEKYGSETPPEYPLHKISGQRIHFMLGEHDNLSNARDIAELKGILGENIASANIYPLCHSSFNYGANTNLYVSDIIKVLPK